MNGSVVWIDREASVLGEALAEFVCIPEAQKRKHVFWEKVALGVQVPFGIYLALQPRLPLWARGLALGGAIATLVVDGSLLRSYQKMERR